MCYSGWELIAHDKLSWLGDVNLSRWMRGVYLKLAVSRIKHTVFTENFQKVPLAPDECLYHEHCEC